MSASHHLPPVLCHEPQGDPIALVCDSPHSGVTYPEGFQCTAPMAAMRQGEDNHIHTLWGAAPELGATLIEATFPRVYIDPNRSLDDLDPEMLDGPWPQPLAPGEKSRLGKGLIWSRLDEDTPIYDQPLAVADVQNRIENYYKPYHKVLAEVIEARYAQFAG